MNKAYVIKGSTEMGDMETLAVYDDEEKANNMLSRLAGKRVCSYDEFWIEEYILNEDISVNGVAL